MNLFFEASIILIMDKLEEKTLSSEIIYEGKIFTVTRDMAKLSNGNERPRDVVHHNGGVVILAEKGSRILMVKQFRYPAQEALYELPAGKLDKKGEDKLAAAKRELLEETGHIAENWEDMGFIYPSPGFCDEKLYLYKASNLTFEKQQPDENEIIDFFEIELEEAFNMIKTGEIKDAKTICSIMKAYKL